MDDTQKTEFYEGLADILEVEASELSAEYAFEEGDWDSLAIISTVMLIDDVFDLQIDGNKLKGLATVGDVEAVIDAA